jgi:hypothetical protein
MVSRPATATTPEAAWAMRGSAQQTQPTTMPACCAVQVRLTLIARVSDGLPLAEGLDRDEDPETRQYDYKNQAKVCACGATPPSTFT